MVSPKRSNDVSTVISMLPYPLDERKPGLAPGVFKMAAAADGDMELLVIERCSHPVYIDENRPHLIVPDPSDVVAQSIVFDHKIAKLDFFAGEAEPGIAWVPGAYENDVDGKAAITVAHSQLLSTMRELQKGWFTRLVQTADDNWARYKMHKFITELERTAAINLGITNREWLIQQRIEEAMSKCRFCFSQVHPDAIICPTCKGVLDAERYRQEFLSHESATVKEASKK